ncbi:MAG: hypothetical protein QXR19_13150 [Candidatus Jordarchaeaceae archaeon]
MKTKTVYYFIVLIFLLLAGVILASCIKYALLSYTGPLVLLHSVLVRFTPIGFYVEQLYLDSFPYPVWTLLGYRPLIIVPVNSQHYFSLFYTGATAIIPATIVLPILNGLIRPLLGMSKYEYFQDTWAKIHFLLTKSSWKKRLTISSTIIFQIIAGSILLIVYSGIFQIIPLTSTNTYILTIIAVGLILLPPILLPKKRLRQLYEQD